MQDIRFAGAVQGFFGCRYDVDREGQPSERPVGLAGGPHGAYSDRLRLPPSLMKTDHESDL
jgi:hypothetical protein